MKVIQFPANPTLTQKARGRQLRQKQIELGETVIMKKDVGVQWLFLLTAYDPFDIQIEFAEGFQAMPHTLPTAYRTQGNPSAS